MGVGGGGEMADVAGCGPRGVVDNAGSGGGRVGVGRARGLDVTEVRRSSTWGSVSFWS